MTAPHRMDRMTDDDLGFDTLSHDDIRRWRDALADVDGAVAALRGARSDGDAAAAKRDLLMAASRARDAESSAAHLMRRYGYADGVDVPDVGRFRVRWLDDGMEVLEAVE